MSEDETSGGVDFGARRVPEGEKAPLIRALFDSVASRYDLMNDLMSGGIHRAWKAEMVAWLKPRPGQVLLDVAGGTGDIALRALPRLAAARTAPVPSIVVCDASFISLALLLERPLSLAAKEATLVALIKPQFESGRGAGKKGVVRDAAAHEAACAKIAEALTRLGWRVAGIAPSPIEGGDGNREFLICGRRP